MRILVIEDEAKIASFVERGLKEQKYAVDVAADGEEGLFKAEINPYDVILLDIMIPKINGLEVCKRLRQRNITTPILMLTARSGLKDRVSGLDAGADDYLAKPFAFEELLARVRALIRRHHPVAQNQLNVGDLELDLSSRNARRAGEDIDLTNKEFSLLEYLMLNAGQVVTRTMISEHVWKESFDSFTNVIDVHIRYLRKKIENGHGSKMIHTVRGVGYILKGAE